MITIHDTNKRRTINVLCRTNQTVCPPVQLPFESYADILKDEKMPLSTRISHSSLPRTYANYAMPTRTVLYEKLYLYLTMLCRNPSTHPFELNNNTD